MHYAVTSRTRNSAAAFADIGAGRQVVRAEAPDAVRDVAAVAVLDLTGLYIILSSYG